MIPPFRHLAIRFVVFFVFSCFERWQTRFFGWNTNKTPLYPSCSWCSSCCDWNTFVFRNTKTFSLVFPANPCGCKVRTRTTRGTPFWTMTTATGIHQGAPQRRHASCPIREASLRQKTCHRNDVTIRHPPAHALPCARSIL